MGRITEQELVNRVLSGETHCFRDLVRRYEEPVAKLIYFNLGDMNEVEDLTQETFLRAYKYLHSYDQKQSLQNWLLAIAANLCRRWHRQKILTVPLKHIFHLSSAENVAEAAVRNQAAEELRELLNTLPNKEAIVLTLHYINELTIREVAAVLSIPEGTVKSRLNRGLNRMRRRLKTNVGRDYDGRQIDRTV